MSKKYMYFVGLYTITGTGNQFDIPRQQCLFLQAKTVQGVQLPTTFVVGVPDTLPSGSLVDAPFK